MRDCDPWWKGIEAGPGPCQLSEECGCAEYGEGAERRVRRRMWRGDSLAFTSQLFYDLTTGRRFMVPIVVPPWPPPRNASPLSLASGSPKLAYTFKYQVEDADMIAVALLDNLLLGGVAIEAGMLGKVDVLLNPINTSRFPDGPVRLEYDGKLYESSGRVTTVERGELVVVPTATRAIT